MDYVRFKQGYNEAEVEFELTPEEKKARAEYMESQAENMFYDYILDQMNPDRGVYNE